MQFLFLAVIAAVLYKAFQPREESGSSSPGTNVSWLTPRDESEADVEVRTGTGSRGSGVLVEVPPWAIQPLAFGAEAPMVPGERVLLSYVVESQKAYLEGVYGGPADPTESGARVGADRIAWAGDSEVATPELGVYPIPMSASPYYSTYLGRVIWTPMGPDAVGLSTFAVMPEISVGDHVTVIVRDRFLSKVIVIAHVRKVTGSSLDVAMEKKYRTLENSGRGPIILPQLLSQAIVSLPKTWLVDPASLTA